MLANKEHHNVHLQRSFSKNGIDNFVWGICEEVFDVSLLLHSEQEWIDALGDYNICREAGSTRGVSASPEARKKMSESRSGEGNPMFGKKRPDVAELMSRLKKGVPLSEEHKQKMSKSLKGSKGPWAYPEVARALKEKLKGINVGRKHTDETKSKVAAAIRGRKASDETKEKLRKASTGRTHTKETKAKIGAFKKGKPLKLSDSERKRRAEAATTIRNKMTDEQKKEAVERLASSKRGVPLSKDHREKLSAATKGKPLSESHLKALKEAAAKKPQMTTAQKSDWIAAIKKSKESRTPEQVAEWKAKIAESHRGKVLSPEHKAAIKAAQARQTPEEKANKQARRRATIAAKKLKL